MVFLKLKLHSIKENLIFSIKTVELGPITSRKNNM